MRGGVSAEIAISILVAVGLSDPARARPAPARAKVVAAQFDCLQGLGARAELPARKTVKLTYSVTEDGARRMVGETDLKPLMEFMRPALASRTDYFACLTAFIENYRDRVYDACIDLNPGVDEDEMRDACSERAYRDDEEFERFLAEVGQNALERVQVPPMTPGLPYASIQGARKLTARQLAARMKAVSRVLSRSCSLEDLAQGDLAVALSSEFVSEALPALAGSGACGKALVRQYAQAASEGQPPPGLCNEARPPKEAPSCFRSRLANQVLVAALERALPRINGVDLGVLKEAGRCFGFERDPALAFSSLRRELESAGHCVPLAEPPPEETRKVGAEQFGLSDWGAVPDYRIRRTGKKSYLVELPVSFQFKGEGISVAQRGRYLKFVDRCLELASPLLRGPDGEQLTLKRTSAEGLAEQVTDLPEGFDASESIVEVRGGAGREDDTTWYEGTSCSTIVHEAMHHLGLVDEYPETADGTIRDPETGQLMKTEKDASQKGLVEDDCRSLGLPNSVMRTQLKALEHAVGKVVDKECVCVPAVGSRPCQALLEEVIAAPPEAPCPPDSRGTVRAEDGRSAFSFSAMSSKDPGESTVKGVRSIRVRRFTGGSPLLNPAQFRAILLPGCASANPRYYACGANAYRSSRNRLGGEGCLPKPKECEDPNWWSR